ncbi:MAG: hypothetical protein ACTSUT_04025 [Promethearchaeota archaeon]
MILKCGIKPRGVKRFEKGVKFVMYSEEIEALRQGTASKRKQFVVNVLKKKGIKPQNKNWYFWYAKKNSKSRKFDSFQKVVY